MSVVLSLGLLVSSAALGADCPLIVYQTDFSTDQGWHTNNPHNFYLDCLADPDPTGAYHTNQVNILDDGEYSCYDVGHNGGSFCLEWDTRVKSVDYAGGVNFGLYASDHVQNGGGNFAQVSFIHEDRGYLARIEWYSAGEFGTDFSVPNEYKLDTWYRTTMEYDAVSQTLTANITERETGDLLAAFNLTNVGPFATDMGCLGASNVIAPGTYIQCPGCVGVAEYDNVVFSVPEPATVCLLGLGALGLLRKRRS
jgi:hypothetical protein